MKQAVFEQARRCRGKHEQMVSRLFAELVGYVSSLIRLCVSVLGPAFVLLLGLGASAHASDVSAALVTRLVPVDQQQLRVELTNTGEWSLEIETRDTPFDHVHAHSMLVVEPSSKNWSPDNRLEYIGRIAKRVAPGPDERLVLSPGETASALVDVVANYRLGSETRYADGMEHRVSLAHYWTVRQLGGNTVTPRSLNSNTTAAKIAPRASTVMSLARSDDLILRARAPSFDGCSAAEQSEITAAAGVAEVMVLDAVAALASVTGEQRFGSPRYTTWFGVYDAVRYSRVQENFSALASTLADETVNYVCGCSEVGVFAYVFPARPYDVYLCPAFWNADIDGTDSRGGTIVHELSHFQVIAGTDDHQYTQAGTQRLAVSSPQLAIDNADTHEYFAENTPFIEMRGSGVASDDPQDGTDLLVAGQSLESSLALDDTLTIRVSGAVRIRVDSLRGDADLEIWQDAGRTELICRSSDVPPFSDYCDVSGEEVWVDVYGSSETDFKVVAIADTSVEVASFALDGSLLDGGEARGDLSTDAYDAFSVYGGVSLELTATSKYFSLYVFEGVETIDARLVCQASASVGLEPLQVVDNCVLSEGGPHTVVVTTAVDGQYSLRTSRGNAENTDGSSISDDDPGFDFLGISSSGCSIGSHSSKGAGGAMPLVSVFILMLLLRLRFRRALALRSRCGRQSRSGRARPGVSSCLTVPALLGFAALSAGCSPAVERAISAPGDAPSSGRASGAALDSRSGDGEAAGEPVLAVGLHLPGDIQAASGEISSLRLPLEVLVWISNPGEAAVEFLLWNTPFEQTLSADVFDVFLAGQRLAYQGRLVKRGAPPASAWIRLMPGQRHEALVDLGAAYDVSAPGSYSLMLAPMTQGEVQRFNSSAAVEVVTKPVQIDLVL